MPKSHPENITRLCAALATKASQDPGLPVPKPTAAYWQSVPPELAHHQSATLPAPADVVIIGSGITGVSTAYHLLQQQPTLAISILEARSLTSGATGRNGGHCKEVPYVDYPELRELHGKEGAGKIVKFRLAQLDALLELSASLGSEAASSAVVRRVNGLDVYYDKEVFDGMKEKLAEYLADFPDEKDTWLVFEGDDINEVGPTFTSI
jgi:glycine/D-amino acid oxidase-like deaminating enzyme